MACVHVVCWTATLMGSSRVVKSSLIGAPFERELASGVSAPGVARRSLSAWFAPELGAGTLINTPAHDDLGGTPPSSRRNTLLELIHGMRRAQRLATAPLQPGRAGPLRVRECITGIGARSS